MLIFINTLGRDVCMYVCICAMPHRQGVEVLSLLLIVVIEEWSSADFAGAMLVSSWEDWVRSSFQFDPDIRFCFDGDCNRL